jgi:ABC-2 type transport system ATP-binding protein
MLQFAPQSGRCVLPRSITESPAFRQVKQPGLGKGSLNGYTKVVLEKLLRMAIIHIDSLKKHFGPVKAVDGITLKIEEGEIFGFLGPNGAGKTTTIRCLMDFLRPTAGRITISDLDAQQDPASVKKIVGYLAPDTRLYEQWTGRQHVDFVAHLRGSDAGAEDLVRRFNLDLKAKVRTLSSGNKQKLSLVLALLGKPRVLILDEPTNALDPLLQNTVYTVLEEYRQQGCTVFFSSHNLAEVERICSRVGIIRQGKLVAVENIKDFAQKRLHLVRATAADSFKPGEFNLAGVTVKDQQEKSVILQVAGDLNPVLRHLATHSLEDLEITHASLEEVFLSFYKGR